MANKKSLLFTLDNRKDNLIDNILEMANSWRMPKKTKLGVLNIQKFSDGELCVDYTSSVRGKRVYIHSSANTSDNIIKLLLAIDAAKRAAAKEIITIVPFFPYARQDKKDQFRGPIGAKLFAQMMEVAGATAVITLDLHADQIQGFFNIPVTHVDGKYIFYPKFMELQTPDTVLCGPDMGSSKRLGRFRKLIQTKSNINVPIVMMDKTREKANEVGTMTLIGDVTDKHVIILDDMVDTAGTLCEAAKILRNSGARSVSAFVTHGVLSGPAYENIDKSQFDKLYVSDSLETKGGHYIIEPISIAQQIGIAMAAINNHTSFEKLKSNEDKYKKKMKIAKV